MNKEVKRIIKNDLSFAIVRKELSLCFQPQIKLETGEIVGTEALLRWRHPKLGWVQPSDFIPIAEESSMIHDLTKWVMKEACSQNKNWHDMGLPKFKVSVNISPINFKRFSIYEMIVSTLEETQLEPHFLELEITESAIMEDIETAKDILNMLKSLGIRVAIDDFGIGNSSLSYLRELPIDVLKIDRSFIKNVPSNLKAAMIVKDVIHLAKNIGLTIVAEGVETDQQVIFLSLHNCHMIQGYIFSKPMFADEIIPNILKCEESAKTKMAGLENEIDIASVKYNDNRFYSLFEHNPDLVCSIDLNGNFLSVNPAFQRVLGYSPKEILYKGITSIMLSSEIEQGSAHFKQVIKQKAPKTIEHTLIHKNKTHRSFSIKCLPILLGEKVVGVYTIGKDITEQKRMVQELAKKEEILRYITETITDLILVIDYNGTIQYASPSHKEILGLNRKEMEGRTLRDWIHPEDFPQVSEEINKMSQMKEPRTIVFRIQHSNGHYIYLESKSTPVAKENDRDFHIVTVSQEISSHKSNVYQNR